MLRVCYFSLLSSPLPNEHREGEIQEDHLAFLQEPISDEEDELDIENVHKDTSKSDLQMSDGELGFENEGKNEDQENGMIFSCLSVLFTKTSFLRVQSGFAVFFSIRFQRRIDTTKHRQLGVCRIAGYFFDSLFYQNALTDDTKRAQK